MKIVFFGTGPYVLPILEQLNKGFEIPLVLTTEKSYTEPVSKFCKEKYIECILVSKFNEAVVSKIKKAGAEIATLAYFGMILPRSVLDIFPKGIINVHPSLLPLYRGSTPGQSALLNGDTKTGVTIIKLDEEVDHGPILVQKEQEILTSDTSSTLYERLFSTGAQLLPNTLHKYLPGELKPAEQNHNEATFTKTLTRDSGFISLEDVPYKKTIENMIRAYFPWPGVWFKAKLGETEKRIILLPEGKIQVEGKKEMSYKDFVNGYAEAKEILQKLNLL